MKNLVRDNPFDPTRDNRNITLHTSGMIIRTV